MWRAENLFGPGEPMLPPDQLIRALLQTRRPAIPAEIDQIIVQMALLHSMRKLRALRLSFAG